jgi:two-component system, OmpR family, response regulator PrrA
MGVVSGPDPGSAAPRVLIVDDDIAVIDTFSRMLRLDGFEVWSATSVVEGLRLADQHLPHAVILDLRMPLAGGLQFLRDLRARPALAHVPVAIVTGEYRVQFDGRADAIRALGAELRLKPLWLDELVALARDLLSVAARD